MTFGSDWNAPDDAAASDLMVPGIVSMHPYTDTATFSYPGLRLPETVGDDPPDHVFDQLLARAFSPGNCWPIGTNEDQTPPHLIKLHSDERN
jgi:hypothetical protein